MNFLATKKAEVVGAALEALADGGLRFLLRLLYQLIQAAS